jgi:hypothetical protein
MVVVSVVGTAQYVSPDLLRVVAGVLGSAPNPEGTVAPVVFRAGAVHDAPMTSTVDDLETSLLGFLESLLDLLFRMLRTQA